MYHDYMKGGTDNIRACRFGRHCYTAEQLWDDGHWYQRGPFMHSAEGAEDYGRRFCIGEPVIHPMITRDHDGRVLMPSVTDRDKV